MPDAKICVAAIRQAFTAIPCPWKSGLKMQWAVPIQGLNFSNVIIPPSSPSP